MAKTRVSIAPPSPNGEGTAEKPAKARPLIVIPDLNFKTMTVKIIGDAPLLVNRMSKKTLEQMEAARQVDEETAPLPATGKKGKRPPRPKRNFEEEFRAAMYPLDGEKGYGFPAIGFKHALVGACRYAPNLDMTLAKRNIFVRPTSFSGGLGMVKIHGEPTLFKTDVRIGSGLNKVPDIRVFARFFPWWAELEIEWNGDLMSTEGLFRLLKFAGKCEGNGEHRPSSPVKCGDNGTWHPAGEGE